MAFATLLWWNIFTVVDVLLLFIYDHLRAQLGPQAVFYINNVIWFLGLDIHHLYFALALWQYDVPTIKKLPQKVTFYPLKQPNILEPRRPKLGNNHTANASGAQDQNQIQDLCEEVESCNATSDFRNLSLEKRPGWKGKGKRNGRFTKRKVTGQKETERGEGREKTNFTYIGDDIGEDRQQASFSKTNFTYIFKRPSTSSLPTIQTVGRPLPLAETGSRAK